MMKPTKQKTKLKFLGVFKELFNPKWRNIVLHGGRAGGKSQAVALALLIRGRQKELRILCTREIQRTIKDSVHKLLKDLINKYELTDYEVKNDSIVNLITGTEFIFKGLRHNINEIKSTEGIDICWVEEAHGITEESLEILAPTIRKEGSQLIFTFNRMTELDPVYVKYVLQKPSNTYVKQVNYDVLDKLGLLPDVIKQEIEDDKDNPALFAHKWLGEPIAQAEFAVIGRPQALEAMQRTIPAEGGIEIGVDVARMGDDRTVFWKRKGLKTLGNQIHNKLRTTEVCDKLEQFANFDKGIPIKVDDTGVGGGVTDEMLRRGYNTVPINFGGKASDNDKYPNMISEAWFQLAHQISDVQLPFDRDLLMELTTRQWKQDNNGKRRIESKNDYKKRGYRSPDLADACIICYYTKQNLLTVGDISM